MRLNARKQRQVKEDAELDITSFMNLMIVLVPVLLMMMVFSRITVVELTLPASSSGASAEQLEQEQLEVLVTADRLDVYFPQGYLVQSIPKIDITKSITDSDEQANGQTNTAQQTGYDYLQLQAVLKQIKQGLLAKGAEKQDITLLLEPGIDYQTIVSLIDYTRSYEDVLINSVVDAELFPNVSLADAPVTVTRASDTQVTP